MSHKPELTAWIAVRSGGFYVIAIPSLYIGVQVLYTIMMYISCFPVVITLRHTNVYEERSLGIYSGDPAAPDMESGLHGTFGVTSVARELGQSGSSAIGRVFRHTFTWHGVGVRKSFTNPTADSHISFIGVSFIDPNHLAKDWSHIDLPNSNRSRDSWRTICGGWRLRSLLLS